MKNLMLLILGTAVTAIASLGESFAKAEHPTSPLFQQLEKEPLLEGEVLRPFNRQDLTGLTHWLRDSGTRDDNNVFSVVNGVVHISGEGMGYLATADNYENYLLSLEYCWGDKTDGSGAVRNSGILLHATGPEGSATNGVWMASIECQLAQGCEGDLIVIRGKDALDKEIPVTITSNTIVAADGKTRWCPTGKKTVYSGTQFWWARHQVGFEELLDTRGKDDVASPCGEWTRVECLCQSDRITIKINGVTVNECYNVFPSSGKILLENEGNEILFRNIEVRPVSK
jgi:hypothetical protein